MDSDVLGGTACTTTGKKNKRSPRSARSASSGPFSPGRSARSKNTGLTDSTTLPFPSTVASSRDISVELACGTSFIIWKPLPYDSTRDQGQRTFHYKGRVVEIPLLPLHELSKDDNSTQRCRTGIGWQVLRSKVKDGTLHTMQGNATNAMVKVYK